MVAYFPAPGEDEAFRFETEGLAKASLVRLTWERAFIPQWLPDCTGNDYTRGAKRGSMGRVAAWEAGTRCAELPTVPADPQWISAG